jgi:hypothetical protein
MQCDEILELLCSEDDTALSPEAAHHLAACSACRAARAELGQTWNLLEAWKAPEPSPTFVGEVMARVRCEAVREAVLSASDEATASHLAQCGDCREELSSIARTWALLDEWKDVEPSPDFTARVMAQVAAQGASPSIAASPGSKVVLEPSRGKAFRRFLRPFATLAAAFALVVGVFFLTRPPAPTPAPVLDQYVHSFDAGRNSAVIDDLPVYVATGSDNPILEDLGDPAATEKTDDVLEDVLRDAHKEG